MRRRQILLLFCSACAFAAVGLADATTAFAKDGDGGGGGGNSGSGGGDSGGRGGGARRRRQRRQRSERRGGGGDSSGRGGGDDSSGRGSGDDGRSGRDDGNGRGGRGGDEDGGGRGRRSGSDDATRNTGWGSTSQDQAKSAVSQGWALPLSTVLPTVVKAVPGRVLQVDLRQSWSGEWRYEFLILTADRRYREVTVDARRNQIIQIRRR